MVVRETGEVRSGHGGGRRSVDVSLKNEPMGKVSFAHGTQLESCAAEYVVYKQLQNAESS